MNNLFIRSFSVNWKEISKDSYLHDIAALKSLKSFTFSSNITFFVGENGSGKSTLLEALAVASGLNAEGGTRNYKFSTYDDYSEFHNALKLNRNAMPPDWSYFLRAESFYNVATANITTYYENGIPDYHAKSHGESFFDFIQNNDSTGLYFLDEPEAALSVQRQLSLIIQLKEMADSGSQFIIATHSPILLGTPGADIYSFDNNKIKKIKYEETESYQITKLFILNRENMLKRMFGE
jgi:predicted ATPase